MSSGKIAGNVIAKCIKAGDVSAKALSQYDAEVREELGKSLDKNYKIKEVVTKVSDKTMDVAAHSLQGVNFENVTITKLVKEIVTRNPALLKELVGLF